MEISDLFNKKTIAATLVAAIAVPTWSSFQHDRQISAAFWAQVNQNTDERLITIETDGVIRQGFLNRGAAIPTVAIGFYNYPSRAFAVAQQPEAACWSTTLRVTEGQENLPFWQKLFGGAEYERLFANQAFDSVTSYSCAPLANEKTIEPSILTPR